MAVNRMIIPVNLGTFTKMIINLYQADSTIPYSSLKCSVLKGFCVQNQAFGTHWLIITYKITSSVT